METDRDRFALLSVLGSGSRTTTEQSAVRTGGTGVRVITVVRLRPESEADPRTRDTFVTKARVLMALAEPTIAATLEFGYAKGSHYVAREFVDGLTLRQILKTARDNRMQLPAAFACHVVLQQCASLLALRRMLRTIAPELAHACFAATIRSIVVGRDGHARWVDPLGLDDPSLPSTTSADPTGEEVSALVGLLYELCTGCTPPRPNEVSEFALVAPSTLRPELPRALDTVARRGLGFAQPSFVGIGGLAALLATTITNLRPPEPSWLEELGGMPAKPVPAIATVTPTMEPPRPIRRTRRIMWGTAIGSVAALVLVAFVLLFGGEKPPPPTADQAAEMPPTPAPVAKSAAPPPSPRPAAAPPVAPPARSLQLEPSPPLSPAVVQPADTQPTRAARPSIERTNPRPSASEIVRASEGDRAAAAEVPLPTSPPKTSRFVAPPPTPAPIAPPPRGHRTHRGGGLSASKLVQALNDPPEPRPHSDAAQPAGGAAAAERASEPPARPEPTKEAPPPPAPAPPKPAAQAHATQAPAPAPPPPAAPHGLDQNQIKRTVASHRDDILTCYERARVLQPNLSGGKVTLRMSVAEDGQVKSVDLANDTSGSSSLQGCLSDRVRNWTFPATAVPSIINIPFLFGE